MENETDCNPCPASAAGKNPHYDTATAAKPEAKKEDAKAAALAEIDNECNPCPASNAGKNPHYPFVGGAAAKEGDKKEAAPAAAAAALAEVECNPCYTSNAGPNTHYNYEGNAKAVPFGKTVPAAPAKKEGDKKEEAKVQLEGYDMTNLSTYSEVISDAAEDSEPTDPVMYSRTIEE
jgi:hypothetical protein